MNVKPKVAAAGVAGSLAVVLAYAVSQFGIVLPGEVVAAVTTLFAFAGGWLRKDKPTA